MPEGKHCEVLNCLLSLIVGPAFLFIRFFSFNSQSYCEVSAYLIFKPQKEFVVWLKKKKQKPFWKLTLYEGAPTTTTPTLALFRNPWRSHTAILKVCTHVRTEPCCVWLLGVGRWEFGQGWVLRERGGRFFRTLGIKKLWQPVVA